METNNTNIDALKTFFKISVSAYDLQFSIAQCFNPNALRCYMHSLLIQGKEEISKEFPDLEKINTIISIIEEKSNNQKCTQED